MPGVELGSLKPSLATTPTKSVKIFRKISQNRQFFRQSARLGKVNNTSRATSDLKN